MRNNNNNNHQSRYLIAVAVIFGSGLLFLSAATTGYTQSDSGNSNNNTVNSSTENATTTTNQTTSSFEGNVEGSIITFNENSKLPTNVEGCQALAQAVDGKAVPDHDLCDVIVYRQAPPIVRSDGLVLNNFSGIGHYLEFVPAIVNETGVFPASTVGGEGQQQQQSDNMTAIMRPTFSNDNLAVAFGEFALLDEEVVPVREVMQRFNWTETALHHHMLDETPKALFLHWSVTGTPNELIQQGREIISVTSTYNQTTTTTDGISTPSSAGP